MAFNSTNKTESSLTDEHKALAVDLLEMAINNTEHPARAVSILMSAAATILGRHFAPSDALDLMTQALDMTGAQLRREMVN